MKNIFLILLVVLTACKNENREASMNATKTIVTEKVVEVKEQSTKQKLEELKAKGFETFDYVDAKTKDTVIMQKYYMAFLKSGAIRTQNEEEATRLQKAHRSHLGKMYDLGYADISGPFDGDGAIRGVTIYNVPTLEMADSLANSDPMVKAGRLKIEIYPWWAAKGFKLR